jgi:hypothetical protein
MVLLLLLMMMIMMMMINLMRRTTTRKLKKMVMLTMITTRRRRRRRMTPLTVFPLWAVGAAPVVHQSAAPPPDPQVQARSGAPHAFRLIEDFLFPLYLVYLSRRYSCPADPQVQARSGARHAFCLVQSCPHPFAGHLGGAHRGKARVHSVLAPSPAEDEKVTLCVIPGRRCAC